MKVFLFLIACIVSFQLSAQKSLKVTDKSIVKDSSGNVYPPAVWRALYMKGDYDLKAEDPNNTNTAFFLVRLPEQDKQKRFAKMSKPKESDFFKTGKKISLFNATDINGNAVDLKELKDKIVVMNFWFINCGPCRREIPDLNNLVEKFKDNDKVVFVAVGLDPVDAQKMFIEKMPFNYKLVEGRNLASNYGIRLFPTHVIVDTESKVYFHTSGLAMNTIYWIEKSINELVSKTNDVAAQ